SAGSGLGVEPDGQFAQRCSIFCCDSPSPAIPLIKSSELHTEDCSVDFIQPAVPSQCLGSIILPLAVIAQQPDLLGNCRIGRNDHSTVAIGSKVFCGIEAERSSAPIRTTPSPICMAAVSLRGVFHNR